MPIRLLLHVLLSLAVVEFAGCNSQPARVYQIEADPIDLARCLMAEGDQDKNQVLTQKELTALPYVAEMMRDYDKNGNGQLNEDEIAARLASVVFSPRIALTPGECLVLRKGSPFTGGRVRLVPAPCLTEYLPIAFGTVDASGIARLSMESKNRPANAPQIAGLIRPGLYRIEVTHPTIQVPRRYNEDTVLGAEASAATLVKGSIAVHLDF